MRNIYHLSRFSGKNAFRILKKNIDFSCTHERMRVYRRYAPGTEVIETSRTFAINGKREIQV